MTTNWHYQGEPVKVMTIAGSDSGGAAGLQADLKTFAALGLYGLCALTVVTAQNSLAVLDSHPLPAEFIARQVDAVLSDYGQAYPLVIKTGFIGRAASIALIAQRLADYRPASLVVDPVLVDHRGQAMFPQAVTDAYRRWLIPLADVVTPNRHEAALLSDRTSGSPERQGEALLSMGAQAILLTGYRIADDVSDHLFTPGGHQVWSSPAIATSNTHGSGDVLSASLAGQLALGADLATAVAEARRFTRQAILNSADWQLGAGHGPVVPQAPC